MFKPLSFLTTCLLVVLIGNAYAQGDLFDPVVDYTTSPNPRSVCIYDFDGDTHLDLVVAMAGNYSNGYAGSVDILINNGDGTFATAVNYATNDYTWSVHVNDFDGVNGGDIVTGNMHSGAPASVSVLLNNGDGTFQAAVNYAAPDRVHAVFSVDLDGDTDIDVIAGFYTDNYVAVYLNNGDGTLQAPVYYTAGSGARGVFAIDLDGDTDNDIISANVNSNSASVLLNNGDGTFQTAVDYAVGTGPVSVFSIDLDGDTDNDVVVGNTGGGGSVSVLLNNGDGTFQAKVDYALDDGTTGIFACDLDDDDDNDLAVAGGTDSLAILLNNGDGTFQAYENYITGGPPYSVYGGDLDGDNDDDLAVVNTTGTVSVLMQSGTPVDVVDISQNTLPEQFRLYQNCPNPFNPGTNIQFDLQRRAQIEVSVYNLLGQQIAVLAKEEFPAGSYSVNWDGIDNEGRAVATGVYFYKLKADGFIETRKMVLLR